MATFTVTPDVRFIVTNDDNYTNDDRPKYEIVIVTPSVRYRSDDLAGAVGADHDNWEAMRSLVSFVSAALESHNYGGNSADGNADLFPVNVLEALDAVSSEIESAAFDLDEGTFISG